MPATLTASNITAPTQLLRANGETYAYRRFGVGRGRPLLFLQHFTGTLDNWDPTVSDPLATSREVILFDDAGVGRSSGKVADTTRGMAKHTLTFLDGLRITNCDVLGFSLGGMVALQMVQDRPSIFRRMILVGTGWVFSYQREPGSLSAGMNPKPKWMPKSGVFLKLMTFSVSATE